MPEPTTSETVIVPTIPPPVPPPDAPPKKDASDRIAEVLGALLVFGPIFYFIVWRNLPLESTMKWIVTAAVLLVAGVIFVFLKAKKVRVFEVMGNLIIVTVIVFGVALCSILFTSETQSELFRIFVILYFSFLPPWLYLQFITTKGETLWDEYVLNLFRLHIDDYANLPEPPKRSTFHRKWSQARETKRSLGEREQDQQEKSIYRKKFEGLFGPIPENDTSTFARFRGENLWPVAIATTLISAGWVLVVKPQSLFHLSIMPETLTPSAAPQIPGDAFRFGFLGAYFYVLQMLVRRYFQNDLKTSAYVNATMRIIIVILLVWTLDLLSGDNAPAQRLAIAFAIGVFPHVGWQALQALIKLPLKLVLPSLSQQYPLSDLDGLNIWYESRLLEEGIEDMQNLATANLVDVMLNTRIPVERLVDWVDQSLLYLRVDKKENGESSKESDRTKLRRYGVRTATDLEDVFKADQMFADAVTTKQQFIEKFERVLNAGDAGAPSVVLAIVATLKREPNLYHVRQWKTFADVNLDVIYKSNEPLAAQTMNFQLEPVIATPTLIEMPVAVLRSSPSE